MKRTTQFKIAAHIVACLHLVVIGGVFASVFCLMIFEPWYIWLPMLVMLVSPVIGGSYCIMNRLENYLRYRAGMPMIVDRITNLFDWSK